MRRELSAETIAWLRHLAARHSVNRHEADDIVQDILLSALESGRDCGDARFLPWACGAIRLRARFIARSVGRRRQREARHTAEQQPQAQELLRLPDEFVAALPPAQRIVAQLVNLGMGRREIAYLLGLSDAAFRQRLAGLRRAAASLRQPPDLVRELDDLRSRRGLDRRALKAAMPKGPGRHFAIRDPDGIPLFFSATHIPVGGGNMKRNPQHGETNVSTI